jgi:hypothetical protein
MRYASGTLFNGGIWPLAFRAALCMTAATTLLVPVHGLHLHAVPSTCFAEQEMPGERSSLETPSFVWPT